MTYITLQINHLGPNPHPDKTLYFTNMQPTQWCAKQIIKCSSKSRKNNGNVSVIIWMKFFRYTIAVSNPTERQIESKQIKNNLTGHQFYIQHIVHEKCKTT